MVARFLKFDIVLFSSKFLFVFNFITTEVVTKKEVWAYPLLSFVAEFGGALGLFLGVSFLSLWDLLEKTAGIIIKIKR